MPGFGAKQWLWCLLAAFACTPPPIGGARDGDTLTKAATRDQPEPQGNATDPATPKPAPVAAQGPESATGKTKREPQAARAAKPSGGTDGVYQLPAGLARLTYDGQLRRGAYDLQTQLGSGKPVALVFWAPGFARSEQMLSRWSQRLAAHGDRLAVFAVSGRRPSQVVGRLWESFVLAGAPPDLPLLVDDAFALTNALSTGDVPNVALFDGQGRLVFAKFKAPKQPLLTTAGRLTAEEIIARVVAGEPTEVSRPMPYYPSQELFEHCAPEFSLPRFDGKGKIHVETRGRKRPLAVLFWSSTCAHCRKEIPQIVDYLAKHPSAIDVVSVTRIAKDKPGRPSHRDRTGQFINQTKMPWPVLEDVDGAVGNRYANVSLPTLFFIAPNGRISSAWYHTREVGFEEAFSAEITKARATRPCAPATSTASPAVSLTLEDQTGKRHVLSSLVSGPTLLHFWATWCKPCVEELPALLRFRERAQKSGTAQVLIVSLDEPEDAVAKVAAFEQSAKLELESFVRPTGDLVERIDLSYRLPRTWLLGGDRELLSIREGSQSWDDEALQKRVAARLGISMLKQ